MAALLLRRRSPENRILVLATALHYAIGFGICSYFFGYFTSLFPGLVIVAGWTFGLTLFDRKPVVVAGIVFLAFVGATTLADWFGWIPYGPLLASAPFEGGHLSGWFLVTIGAITGILLLAVLVLIDFIIENWHRHQKQIVAMSEQLSRANEVISRYVASQLAQKIREGQHDDAALPSRRRLTLVFSDIVDFSDTADELEPEDLSQLLNEYLAEMTTLAEKIRGHGRQVRRRRRGLLLRGSGRDGRPRPRASRRADGAGDESTRCRVGAELAQVRGPQAATHSHRGQHRRRQHRQLRLHAPHGLHRDRKTGEPRGASGGTV